MHCRSLRFICDNVYSLTCSNMYFYIPLFNNNSVKLKLQNTIKNTISINSIFPCHDDWLCILIHYWSKNVGKMAAICCVNYTLFCTEINNNIILNKLNECKNKEVIGVVFWIKNNML